MDYTVYVTQPSLPNLEDYTALLQQIWDSKILTNNGPFHQLFENALAKHLGVKYISVFNNGTIGLLTAFQALEIKGEVITTPFSFVATANSLLWNNLTPVFCDVDPIYGNLDPTKIEPLITKNTSAILPVHVYGNLDPTKIEPLITKNTSAILPVHVYGNPANVEQIQEISSKYKLKVIYDAAHAFGVEINNTSVLNYGDLSVLSFHATKTFNSVEGGAIISHTAEMKQKIDQLKNFGITNEVTVVAPGINGKMNELIAAYGLLQLKDVDKQITKRNAVASYYSQQLNKIKGIRIINDDALVKSNYSYYPIFIDVNEYGISRDELYEQLKEQNIYSRRYFYPLISNFPTYKNYLSSSKKLLPVANHLSEQVLCLPLYANLEIETAKTIVDFIQFFSKNKC
ncbi:MAG: aminotransferase [Bacteroidetes bacterium RIFCSPLOWO2_12_FULL_31_6]|nr:MAG: aminotransferase [Bacteroidetes bacterium RIFCSPLOWO2_12_FULL_31_6]